MDNMEILVVVVLVLQVLMVLDLLVPPVVRVVHLEMVIKIISRSILQICLTD